MKKLRALLARLRGSQKGRRGRQGALKKRLDLLRAAIKRGAKRVGHVRHRIRRRRRDKTPLVQPAADVSMFQGSVDFGTYAKSWIGVKATEGLSWIDPFFNGSRVAAIHKREPELVPIYYHFAHPTDSGSAQAEHFAKTILAAGARKGDLAALDLETASSGGQTFFNAFVKAFRAKAPEIGLGVYGPKYVLDELADNLDCWLWLAAYVSDPAPWVPRAWKTWTFWQFTDHYSFAGISSPCDASRFNGDREAFDRLGA